MDAFQAWWRESAPEGTFQKVALAAWDEAEVRERLICAALVRDVGCSCDNPEAEEDGHHYDACPIALAAAIEGRGK